MSSGRLAAVAPEVYEAMAARAPAEVDVIELTGQTDLAGVNFLVPPSGKRDVLGVLPELDSLSVVQVLSAGTDWIEGHLPPNTTLCSARGARDGPVAEWVVGALLGASTGLLECARRRQWHSRRLQDLCSWHVVIVGMGSIGRLVAERLDALDVRVTGVASDAHDGLHGVDELPELLPDCTALVLLTPLTPTTHRLVNSEVLSALPDGAVLINAARGAVVDTDALLTEVQSGRIRAVLDVTDPEPLPDDHPLWAAPGVLSITPHMAGDSPVGSARAAALAGDQLARWCAGAPLLNVVRDGSPVRD